MPSPSEMERQAQEAMQDEGDLQERPTHEQLEERAKAMGFDDLAAAMKYLEALEENPPAGSAKNPIKPGERVEQPPIQPTPRHRG